MELLYMGLWLAWIVGTLSMFFGLPVWLVLAFLAYRASERSRRAMASALDLGSVREPEVTPYGAPTKIIAIVSAGVLASAALASVLNTGIPMSGKLSIALRGISSALFALGPGILAVLATLSVVSIVDMHRRLRVAGVDTVVAYWLTIALAAILLVLTLTGVLHGERG